VRYEVTEDPPRRLALGLAAQSVALIVSGIVLTPVIVLRAAAVDATTTAWSIFAALLVSGLTTILQARPLGRIGAGYVLFMGTSGAFISVGIDALQQGGMALLMSLIIVSSGIEFALAGRLGGLRRIVTPTVGGTTVMLIAVTVMPIAFGMLDDGPAGVDVRGSGPPAAALSAFGVIVALSLFGNGRWRLWSPLLGLIAGTLVAAPFGLVDLNPVRAAAWVGLPVLAWPGLDLSFGSTFWLLVPAFAIVTLVGAIETYGDGIAIQRVSWRTARAIDYRAVQGALYADGAGNLLSGLAGTLPNTTYSTSISTVEMTGVAARRVGVYGGALLMLLAFSPKLSALLLAVPNAVVGSYLVVLIVLLFMHGLKVATEGGIDFDRALVIGLSLWLGIGFQGKLLYYDWLPHWAASLLSNGMTAGALVAVLLTLLLRLKAGRGRHLQTTLSMTALPTIHDFVLGAARAAGWGPVSTSRLQLAAEEALVVLVEHAGSGEPRQLRLEAHAGADALELEFLIAPLGVNLQDQRALLRGRAGEPDEALSFRILESIADEIAHQQYHEIDFLSLRLSPRA
jgi:xanthine permease XanP